MAKQQNNRVLQEEQRTNGSKPHGLIDRWAALIGRWTFQGGKATFHGSDDNESPLGLALAGASFRNGSIRTRLKLARNKQTTASILLGYQSMTAPYVLVQLGAHDKAYAVSEYRPNLGFELLASAGLLSNIDPEVEHELAVTLEGQSLSMRVDGVNVLSMLLRQPINGEGMGLEAWGDAAVVFEETYFEARSPRVFVMMPFAEPFDALYRDVIKPVAEDELDFEVVRVDEIQAPGLVIDDVQRQIAASNVVVAEISTRNPNVFYELGYAHALRKPAVILVRREDRNDVPFDLRGYRAIYYDDSIGGKKAVEQNLRSYLQAVKSGGLTDTVPV